jgi:hypothetical protein
MKTQNIREIAKIDLKGNLIAMAAYMLKKNQMSKNLMMHLKLLEKHVRPKITRGKEIIKTRAEIN